MPVPSNSVVKWESLNIYIMVLIFLSGFFFFPFVRAIPFTERHGMTGNEEGGGGGWHANEKGRTWDSRPTDPPG